MDKYQEVRFLAGNCIDDAVNELLKYRDKGVLVCINFNGHMLYSDKVTMDSAYIKIIGQSKDEFDKAQREFLDNIKRQNESHKAQIPELTKMWMKKGREVLTKDKWKLWDKIVPIRLSDLYQGMELRCCLDIVKILNNNRPLAEAKEMINSQSHSGTSHSLVCAMVRDFCTRGESFVDYVQNTK